MSDKGQGLPGVDPERKVWKYDLFLSVTEPHLAKLNLSLQILYGLIRPLDNV
jgi:hypothetical protein